MTPLEHAGLAAVANDVDFERAVVLQDTNNVVVWLEPSPVVVKVGRWSHSTPGLLREHAVARHLAGSGAPVGEPVGAPFVESSTPMVSTLWSRIEATQDSELVDPVDLAACLATVHSALADVAVDLPDYREWLDLAARTLHHDDAVHRLAESDRDLLRTCYAQLRTQIDVHPIDLRPIHGEPHTGNFMAAKDGLFLIDFETVCAGPIEWDLASLSERLAIRFEEVDDQLLGMLRILNSIRVATWCFASPSESMHTHGVHHLGIVRAWSSD